MSKKKHSPMQAAIREKAAEYLLASFSWDDMPFPDLSKEDGHRDKWLALYKYLKKLSKEV